MRRVTWGTIGDGRAKYVREWFVSLRLGRFRHLWVVYRLLDTGRWGFRRARWLLTPDPAGALDSD